MARWLKLFLFIVGLACLALAISPWWLGLALRPILGHWGIAFERYERVGYSHFQLHGVRYQNSAVILTAQRVATSTPLVWLAQRLSGTEPNLTVENWKIQRNPEASPPSSSGTKTVTGFPALQTVLSRLAPRLAYWLPRVQLSGGELRDFKPEMEIAEANWQNSVLNVPVLRVMGHQLAAVVTPKPDGSFELTGHTPENDIRLRLHWRGVEMAGETMLWDQPLQLAARFPAKGWLPDEASAVADNWRLPAARVKLGSPYAQVTGDARLTWREGRFEFSGKARAEPAADHKGKAPPFEANATAQGNLREVTVTALHADTPFATAKLSAPVTFSVDRPVAAESAQLVVEADLAKLPWLEARGKVQGMVTVRGDNALARQTFALKFSDLALQDFSIKAAEATGALEWPRLELTQLKLQLDDASAVEAHGAVNWKTRELANVAVAAKLGPRWFARWLPADMSWTTAELSVTGDGPLDTPRHQGSLKLTGAHLPPLHPLAIDTSWRGAGAMLEISARATAENSSMDLAGTLEPRGLQLKKLQLTAADQITWNLASPARIAWLPAWEINDLALVAQGTSAGLSVQGSAKSEARVPPNSDASIRLHARGGSDGTFELTATHFNSVWLRDWLTFVGPAWQVHSLQATGRVVKGVLDFDTVLTAQIEMQPQPAQVKLSAHGDARGIELKEFKVLEADRVLTQATGRLPLVWSAEAKPHLSLDETTPLELSASTEPDSPLWATLVGYSGLQLDRPTAKLNLKGTFRQPEGELEVNVAKLSAVPGKYKYPLPEFDNLAVAVNLTRDKIIVKSLSGKIEGQDVQANGEVPMDDDQWKNLWRAPGSFDWGKAAGRVDIANADLAAIAQHWPNFIITQGHLSVHVALAPEKKFQGELHLEDAVSHPLPALGALREIKADLVLADQRISVRTMSAKLGGEPVAVDGSITLEPEGAPRLALGLKGKNLPLVRNTGLLLRSDVDLHADTNAAGLTRLSGVLIVRDCLVLANVDLKTLLPTGLRGVTRQPPYFAVAAEPFRHWPLEVEMRAPSAVRVRTTAYSGMASAHFLLSGTLGEPRAVGELTVDKGQVLFPFATFTVQQGAVRLPEADPFHAVVSLNATSLHRDYQMRLEMKGELPTPNVAITSTPALEAADVLLMVMTGQQPAGETTAAASAGPRLAMLGAYLGRGLFQDLGFGGEDRLEISSGEHISRQGRETYDFEYKLGERWSLLGEYDQFDSYNAGVKWRLYTEESKPREKK